MYAIRSYYDHDPTHENRSDSSARDPQGQGGNQGAGRNALARIAHGHENPVARTSHPGGDLDAAGTARRGHGPRTDDGVPGGKSV